MFASKISSEFFTPERLEPSFYSPDYFAALNLVSKFNPFPVGEACELWSFGSYGLYNDIEWTAAGDGFPYVRMDSFEPPFVNWDQVSWISAPSHELVAKSHAVEGDVLVSVSGTIGKVAIVLRPPVAVVSTNQHTIKVRPRRPEFLDAAFLAVYFMSRPAQAFLAREAGGAVQKEIYLYNFARVPLPSVDIRAQRYIANKVRQAESLRERARGLTGLLLVGVEAVLTRDSGVEPTTRALRAALLAEHGPPDFSPTSMATEGAFSTTAKPNEIIDRLNAESYSPSLLRNARLISSWGKLVSSLGDLVCAPINNSIRDVAEQLGLQGVPMFRPKDIDGLWLNADTAPRIPVEFELEHQKARIFPGDILLSIAGSVGVAARVPSHISYGAVNGSSARIRPKDGLKGYLLVYLNTPVGQRTLLRLAVGSVQKHLNLVDLPSVPVVLPSPELVAVVDVAVETAERWTLLSRWLVEAAKHLVEALIEGKLTEQDLIYASQHPAQDRALLARLSRKGLDLPGEPPLFPDLDVLVDALGQLNAAAAVGSP